MSDLESWRHDAMRQRPGLSEREVVIADLTFYADDLIDSIDGSDEARGEDRHRETLANVMRHAAKFIELESKCE